MEGRTRLRPTTAGIVIAILAVVVLAVDQFTKHLALQNLPYQQIVPVWGDVLQFYLTRNSGAAFSLGEGVTWVFTIVLAIAALLIVFLAATRVRGGCAHYPPLLGRYKVSGGAKVVMFKGKRTRRT